MYRILLILYIIWGGVSIASGQDFNYSFTQLSTNQGSPDKPGGLSIQLCKSEKKEFYIRYSS